MTKKLIVRISGGLGNQLYTYAAALRLAKKNDAQLLIDPYSGFTKDFYQQPFQLDKLSVSAPIASDSDCFISRISRFKWSLLRRLNKQLPYIKRWVIFEEQSSKKKTAFDSRLLDFKLHKKKYYMTGLYQCEKYFADIRAVLIKEFTVHTPMGKKTLEVARQIQTCSTPVALHARQLRGAPNIPNATLKDNRPQLPFNYYERAIDLISKTVSTPHFFCFGDNPNWIKKHWNSDYNVTFVDHNDGQDEAVQDFYLMSLCRHFILGNSTFSWWPAWLSNNTNKIVIAPANRAPFEWSGNHEVIPADWITLDPVASATRINT